MKITTTSKISELGPGAGYALWDFRTAAIDHIDRPALRSGFYEVFRHDTEQSLRWFYSFAGTLGNSGSRRISIAYPDCETITADEMSIVALLSCAQPRDAAQCALYLSWLMCGRNEDQALTLKASLNIGALFQAAGLQIEKPEIEITAPAFSGPVMSYHAIGQA